MSSPVPKRDKYVPKHRHAPASPSLVQAPKKAIRNTVLLSSVAVAATGAAVSGGLASSPATVTTAAQDLGEQTTPSSEDTAQDGAAGGKHALSADEVADRAESVSRSADRRDATDPAKKAALKQDDGPAMTRTEDLADDDPRDIARALLPQFGFSSDQFGCLDDLYVGESGWRVDADNPTSSAYGIPQALPGSKMASAGPDWETNPVTQIKWGLGYIQDRYGSPCGAMNFKHANGWY